ncbi:MAG: hypothetical protein KDA47_18820 [Planctomycetales bacterium]|nr:hypothetical protein [Planctomycetales bacterium]
MLKIASLESQPTDLPVQRNRRQAEQVVSIRRTLRRVKLEVEAQNAETQASEVNSMPFRPPRAEQHGRGNSQVA